MSAQFLSGLRNIQTSTQSLRDDVTALEPRDGETDSQYAFRLGRLTNAMNRKLNAIDSQVSELLEKQLWPRK